MIANMNYIRNCCQFWNHSWAFVIIKQTFIQKCLSIYSNIYSFLNNLFLDCCRSDVKVKTQTKVFNNQC